MKNGFLIFGLLLFSSHCFAQEQNDDYCQDNLCTFDCGENCTASLNLNTGHFKVEGSGDMTDFGYQKSPWHPYKQSIQSVEISDDITSIGSDFLNTANHVTEVHIPENVTKIGNWAFLDTHLSDVTIPDSVISIRAYAFSTPTLTHIDLPKNLEFLGAAFCQNCKLLDALIIPETVIRMDLLDGYTPFNGSVQKVYCSQVNANLCQEALEKALNHKSDDFLSTYRKISNRFELNGRLYKSFSDMQKNIPVKRIYTIKEANEVSGPVNRVSITYR